MKTHLAINGHPACGRGKRTTNNPFQVSCLVCDQRPEVIEAKATAAAAQMEAFLAQEPRKFSEPWRDGTITCECGSDLFRQAARTCYGHYANYVCAACGQTTRRLTETGMSF